VEAQCRQARGGGVVQENKGRRRGAKAEPEKWRTIDPQSKRTLFTPVKVRLRIEDHQKKAPIDEHRYRALSDIALHVTGPISPQSHNLLEMPVSAGHFQQEGFFVGLNELALVMVYVAVFASILIPGNSDIRRLIRCAGLGLGEEVGGVDILHISDYRNQTRDHFATAPELRSDSKGESSEEEVTG
jgi:hypothetical protein